MHTGRVEISGSQVDTLVGVLHGVVNLLESGVRPNTQFAADLRALAFELRGSDGDRDAWDKISGRETERAIRDALGHPGE